MWYFKMILLLCSLPLSLSAWEQKPPTGWLWYKDPAPLREKPQVKKETQQRSSLPSQAPKTYKQQIKDVREKFEEALSKSILIPTLENVTITQRLQKQVMDQAEAFSKVWVLASLVDEAQEKGAPQNALSQKIYQEEREKRLKTKLRSLSRHFGLFVALKENCPYCHRFAPLAQEFADAFGFDLKGISKGRGTYPVLKNVSKDNGALSLINPEGVYPALFLVRYKSGEVIPLAWGLVSTQELLRNAEIVINALEEGQ